MKSKTLFISLFLFLSLFVSMVSAVSCSDGIQNGDEEGIDCGGSCPNPCNCDVVLFEDDAETGDIYNKWVLGEGNVGEAYYSETESHTGSKSIFLDGNTYTRIETIFPLVDNAKLSAWFFDTMEEPLTSGFNVKIAWNKSSEPRWTHHLGAFPGDSNDPNVYKFHTRYEYDYKLMYDATTPRSYGWHFAQIEFEPGQLNYYIDGTLEASHDKTGYANYVGLTSDPIPVYFDDIKVTTRGYCNQFCDGTELLCDDFEDGDWTNNPTWTYWHTHGTPIVTSEAAYLSKDGLDFSNVYGTMLAVDIAAEPSYEKGFKGNFSVWVYDDGGNNGGCQDSLIETKIFHSDGQGDTIRLGRHHAYTGYNYGCVSESIGICPISWHYLSDGSLGWHLFEIHVLDNSIEIYIDGYLVRDAQIDATIWKVLVGTNNNRHSGVESYYDSIKLVENIYPTCTDGIQNGDEEGIDCGGSCPNPCECETIVFADDAESDLLSEWELLFGNASYTSLRSYSGDKSIYLDSREPNFQGYYSTVLIKYVNSDRLELIFYDNLDSSIRFTAGGMTLSNTTAIALEADTSIYPDHYLISIGRPGGSDKYPTGVHRELGWHKLVIDIQDHKTLIYIDGDVAYTHNVGGDSDQIFIGVSGYNSNEGWFDDIVAYSKECPPTCYDGIQNGDEEGIDCGGNCPNECDSCILENPSLFVAHDTFPKWSEVFTNFNDSLYEWDNMLGFMWYRYNYEDNPLMNIYGSSSSDIDNWPLGFGSSGGGSCLSYCPNQDKIIAISSQFTSKLGNAYIMTLDPDTGDMQIVDYPKSDTYFEMVGDCIYSPQDDSVYILGGWETTQVTDEPRVYHRTTNDVHRFDCASNTVEQMANDLPGHIGMGYLSGGYSSSDNSIYLFGYGWNDGNYGTGYGIDITRYDLDSKISEDTGTDLIGVIALTLPIYIPEQNVFLLFGGRSGNAGDRAGTTQVLKYDVAANSITILPIVLPYPVESAFGGIIRNGDNIYLFDNDMVDQAMVYNIQDMSIRVIDFVWPTLIPDRWKGPYYDVVQPNPHEFYIASAAHILKAEFSGSCGTTCTDGIQNGDEEGIDCGGSCPPCPSPDFDGDGYTADVDCNDNNPAIHPGAEELCDGFDNNCDGIVDEIIQSCGLGICEGTRVCNNSTLSTWSDCSTSGTDAGICSICDSDGNIIYDGTQDLDCASNNLAEVNTCTYDPDNNPFTIDYASAFLSQCIGISECSIGTYNFTHTCSVDTCSAECDSSNECSDTLCQAMDGCYEGTYRDYNDVSNVCLDNCICTNNVCEDYSEIITDMDNDGHDIECDADCNDADATIYPGAPELCDRKDNDCDGTIPSDEIDDDGDGMTECEGDCNDDDATIYQGAPELCDGKDNDCNDLVDEGYPDYDGDGIADCVDEDDDNDGVIDIDDLCGPTQLPELIESLVPNNFADVDGDGLFETNAGSSSNPIIEDSAYTLVDTYGCSCEQILICKPGENKGEIKHGCSQGTMNIFIQQTSWSTECFSDGAFLEGESKSVLENTDQSGLIDMIDSDNDNDGISDSNEINEGMQVDDAQEDGKPDWWCEKHPTKC